MSTPLKSIIVHYRTFHFIPKFNLKYIAMYKLQIYAGAISKLLYGIACVRAIIHSLMFVDYLPVRTHQPYNKTYYCSLRVLLLESSTSNKTKYLNTIRLNLGLFAHVQWAIGKDLTRMLVSTFSVRPCEG